VSRARRPTEPGDARAGWQFWIDRGGTFTDGIGVAPDGALRTAKVLSSDEAPVEVIRRLLADAGASADRLPPACVALGTTVATNALLERRGVPTLFVTQEGFGDLLAQINHRQELIAHDGAVAAQSLGRLAQSQQTGQAGPLLKAAAQLRGASPDINELLDRGSCEWVAWHAALSEVASRCACVQPSGAPSEGWGE